MKVEAGKKYYFGNTIKTFKCIEAVEGEDNQSWFTDYKNHKFQFYNHDMYIDKNKSV